VATGTSTDAWRVSGKYLYNKRQVIEPYGSFVLATEHA
jgi:hypothetical protein